MLAVARIFDLSGRHARNRAPGKADKHRALAHEHAVFAAHRKDLAGQVRCVADLDGDGAGYVIASFTAKGAPRLIQIKTTSDYDRPPFTSAQTNLS